MITTLKEANNLKRGSHKLKLVDGIYKDYTIEVQHNSNLCIIAKGNTRFDVRLPDNAKVRVYN